MRGAPDSAPAPGASRCSPGQPGTAAEAGVGGGDEPEAGETVRGAGCSRDDDAGVLERLAERLEPAREELRQFVQRRRPSLR